jgi:hypothetical protein
MNFRLKDLEDLKFEDLEEFDCLLVWDESEQKTKKVEFQSLILFLQMMSGNLDNVDKIENLE